MPQPIVRIVTAVTLATVTMAAVQTAPTQLCQRVQLAKARPGWTNSGAWTDKGDLLIADALRKQILRYSKEGRALGGLPNKIGTALGEFFPQILRSADGKLVIEVTGGNLVVLNRAYIPLAKVDVHVKASNVSASTDEIAALSLWEPVGKDILSFSTLKVSGGGGYALGLISFPLDQPQAFETLWRTSKYDESLSAFYRLGHDYITSLDGAGYTLLMENKMSILREKGGKLASSSTAFPPQLDLRPQLPSFEAPADLPWVMKAVEASVMPTGLYGWEHALYLLWRRPEGAETRWFLTKIDPNEGRVLRTVSIKTTANHLTVVPGPDAWAFIEKGPVRNWGVQSINSILLVPAGRVRSAFQEGGDLCQ